MNPNTKRREGWEKAVALARTKDPGRKILVPVESIEWAQDMHILLTLMHKNTFDLASKIVKMTSVATGITNKNAGAPVEGTSAKGEKE